MQYCTCDCCGFCLSFRQLAFMFVLHRFNRGDYGNMGGGGGGSFNQCKCDLVILAFSVSICVNYKNYSTEPYVHVCSC